MSELHFDATELDAAMEAYVAADGEKVLGNAIEALKSEKLQQFADAASTLEGIFPNHTLHALVAGIIIGIKLS